MAACCARFAPALLMHVNLLLGVYAGAGLATAARLKWDPSTYVPLRELFPLEYRVAAVTLCAAAATLLALAHLAVCALSLASAARTAARCLLLTYAVLMTVLVCAEVSWLGWCGARVSAWLHSEQAAQVLELLELREHLQPILALLARWHPLPDKIRELMEEAALDAPRNLYVACAALAVVVALQAAAALLALCAAAAARPAAAAADSLSYLSTDNEKAPLKTAFRNGKLVVL